MSKIFLFFTFIGFEGKEGEKALHISGKRVQVHAIGNCDNVYTRTGMGADKAGLIPKARVALIA